MVEFIRIKEITSVIRLNLSIPKDSRVNRKTNAIAIKTAGKTVYSHNGERYISCPGKAIVLGKGSSYEIDFIEPGECFLIEFQEFCRNNSFHGFHPCFFRKIEVVG